MGYRLEEKPFNPEDHLHRFCVRNGTIGKMAFGCYYLVEHDYKLHDHIGWPDPDKPDRICQIVSSPVSNPIFLTKNGIVNNLEEIHLLDEGYDTAAITFEDDEIEYYTSIEAYIDEEDDYIVHLNVKAEFPSFSNNPKDYKFTLFVKKSDGTAIDAVCHAVLSILPGSPYQD